MKKLLCFAALVLAPTMIAADDRGTSTKSAEELNAELAFLTSMQTELSIGPREEGRVWAAFAMIGVCKQMSRDEASYLMAEIALPVVQLVNADARADVPSNTWDRTLRGGCDMTDDSFADTWGMLYQINEQVAVQNAIVEIRQVLARRLLVEPTGLESNMAAYFEQILEIRGCVEGQDAANPLCQIEPVTGDPSTQFQ